MCTNCDCSKSSFGVHDMRNLWKSVSIAAVAVLCCTPIASAVQVDINGGQTSVLLDTGTLGSVGLDLSSVSSTVIAPGNLGADSVAFPDQFPVGDRAAAANDFFLRFRRFPGHVLGSDRA